MFITWLSRKSNNYKVDILIFGDEDETSQTKDDFRLKKQGIRVKLRTIV